jgi:trimeric autotransporter adhesin
VGSIQVSDLPSGSTSYIQNTITPQAGNFSITGDGTAGGTLSGNTVNTASQYSLNGVPVLRVTGIYAPQTNTFVGIGSGSSTTPSQVNYLGHYNTFLGHLSGNSNTTGLYNAFFGNEAGRANTTGYGNALYGTFAGFANTSGVYNSFFGFAAGRLTTTGSGNSFFGKEAGNNNTTGENNSFFGNGAGYANTTGSLNTFFGAFTGLGNITGGSNAFFGFNAGANNNFGSQNVFIGREAGALNQLGSDNTFVGDYTGNPNTTGNLNTYIGSSTTGAEGVNNATAIGARSFVTQSNSLVLGSINGTNGATANTSVGIGTTAPKAKLDVTGGDIFVGSPGQGIILKSPDGTKCTKLSIDNAGSLQINTLPSCP